MAYVGAKYADRSTKLYELSEYLALPDDPEEVEAIMLRDLHTMMEWANANHRIAPRRTPNEKYIERIVRACTKHDNQMGARSERLQVDTSGGG